MDDKRTTRRTPEYTQQTDTEVRRTDIHRLLLEADSFIDDFTVNINNGVVVLNGTASSIWNRMLVQEIAYRARGVKLVINMLGVRTRNIISDRLVNQEIVSTLQTNDIEDEAINVSVSEGEVTLSGAVRSFSERSKALSIGRYAIGAKRIVDKLNYI